MALALIKRGYINIPSTKIPITLNFTGATNINVNCYYDINTNIASLYIPSFAHNATTNGYLQAQLPPNLTPFSQISLIGSVIYSTSPTISSEIQGIITITNTGLLTISADITYDQFIQGNMCGTFTGQTLIFNLN